MNRPPKLFWLIALCFTATPFAAPAQDSADEWVTRSGYYTVSFTSDLTPITINRIHSWTIHVNDATGAAVENARISLSGGMPEHNHGLPTSPRMLDALGNGDYVIGGMRFHMSGYWELTLQVDVDGRRDSVVIPVTIQ